MIEVSVLRVKEEQDWEMFISQANNGTLFHRLKFLGYHSPRRFASHHLLFQQQGVLLAVIPGAMLEKKGKTIFKSPYGASFGGLVISDKQTLFDCLAIVKALVDYCRQRGLSGIEITGVPRAYWDTYDDQLDYAMLSQGFCCQTTVLDYVIELNGGDITQSFSKNMRRDIRQNLRRGVCVEKAEIDQLDCFYQMLSDNKLKNNAAVTHSKEDLRLLLTLFPRVIELYFAYLEGEPIAAIVLFSCNDNAALTFYICHREAFSSYCPVAVLIDHLVTLCASRGYRYLDLGPSSWPDLTLHESLIRYKQRFAAKGMRRDSWALFF